MAASSVREVLPPVLDSTSEPPPLFDGITRLYLCYQCPFAQRAWIARNTKGLQDRIKLVPINLENRPAWYKEKVYPENKVPSLEHKNKVIGESLEIVKYIDSNFEGPALLPSDPAKLQFAEEFLSYIDTFNKSVYASFKGDPLKEAGKVQSLLQFRIYASFKGDPLKDADPAFDYIENALQKFNDGPFFLGDQFSQVDIAYAPFIERFQIFLEDVWKYDITSGRPKLAAWIEELSKMDGYTQTKCDPIRLVKYFKKRFLDQQ